MITRPNLSQAREAFTSKRHFGVAPGKSPAHLGATGDARAFDPGTGEQAMKIPGPDHPITVTANPKRVRILYQGHEIADTRAALTLQESTYPAVQYVPRADVAMEFLTRTDHSSHCPYKGDASYFTLVRDGVISENAVWSYETPFPAMTEIKDYLAFYPNKVEIVETEDGAIAADAMRDIIEHTDSGSGASQKEHWAANVSEPPAG
jgi:uncharacterized protein (DUF427 family)